VAETAGRVLDAKQGAEQELELRLVQKVDFAVESRVAETARALMQSMINWG